MKQGWNSTIEDEDVDIISRIRECRRHIAVWKKKAKVKSEAKIKKLKWQIHSLTHEENFSSQALGELKQQLRRAYREEEEYWRQQSRIEKW